MAGKFFLRWELVKCLFWTPATEYKVTSLFSSDITLASGCFILHINLMLCCIQSNLKDQVVDEGEEGNIDMQ